MPPTSEKSLYSKTTYKAIIEETVRFVNHKNEKCENFNELTMIDLAKDLVEHRLLPTSIYHEINGKGSGAIIPRQLCNAMLKNKQKRCSRNVKKPGDEFCFHHINLFEQGGSIKTWDEYQAIKNKNYIGKKLKKSEGVCEKNSNSDYVELILDDSDIE